jgi:hypothetical protein
MRIPQTCCLALVVLTGCSSNYNTAELQKAEKSGKKSADAKDDKYDGKGIFGKTTRELVDKKTAMAANPDLVVVNSDTTARGKGTRQGGSIYSDSVSFIGSIPLQQHIKLHQAQHGKFPTYAEMDAWMKKNPGVALPLIEQWRQYGYDDEAGTIVILEDKKVKERIYKEKGIPLD